MECLFGSLTREGIAPRQDRPVDEVFQDICEYIELLCHRLSRHSTLGYNSPAEFEARMVVA